MSQPAPTIITLPHSRETEMRVLGCMLSSINSLNVAADMLEAPDFFFGEHRQIFQVLQTFYKQDRPADLHLVAEELKRQDKLQNIGGIAYLTELMHVAGTSAYIEEYSGLIKNKSMLRKMVQAAESIEKTALNEPPDVAAALDEAQSMLFQISQKGFGRIGTTLNEILTGVKAESKEPFLKALEAKQERYRTLGPQESCLTGLPSHFVDFDRMLNGLNRSHLMILAARPAMGKTALALNIAENVAFKTGKPVGLFSLEMTAEQLAHRVICSQSAVESEKIKTGSLSGEEYQQVVEAVRRMQKYQLIIDDQPGLTISDLRARARRMREAHGIELLVIDYLQLISGSGSSKSAENRQNEISEISRVLKTLARELNIPVICLSQLSRKVEERPSHRPMLSDLRESGSIEQDADVVMFLLRREYYDPLDKPGTGELIIAKNRHGAVGSVQLTYRKEISQFSNFSPDMIHDIDLENQAHNNFKAFSPNGAF
jgi:replicative DNA helicase